MTASLSTGSGGGGQSCVLYPDGLPVYREILCPHNTVTQSSHLSIHIFQQSVRTLARQTQSRPGNPATRGGLVLITYVMALESHATLTLPDHGSAETGCHHGRIQKRNVLE